MSEKPLRVKCNRAGAAEGCKTCPHSQEHDEILPPPGVEISHKPPIICSEGGRVRCLPTKKEDSNAGE